MGYPRRVTGIALTLVLALGSAPASASAVKPPSQLPATPPLALLPAAPSLFDTIDPGVAVAPPRVRVGLSTDRREVALGSTAGRLRLLDGKGGAELWTDRAAGPVRVVRDVGIEDRDATLEEVRRIQVGAFRDEPQAKDLGARLETELRQPAITYWDSDRNVWRVRIGEATEPEALKPLLAQVRESGYPDAWIVREPVRRLAGASLRLLDARWNVKAVATDRIVAVPPAGALVTVEGRPYRGLVEVRLTPYGEVLAINEIGVEDYLRGVVPEELGPNLYPELEAQKAQAVAARTYAFGNLGQFVTDGYDMCDTPRCQVYRGAGSEQPLSDRAIRETRGEILVWNGAPVNALFTSTCGGHTEDVELVFPEWDYPYLRGVPCGLPRRNAPSAARRWSETRSPRSPARPTPDRSRSSSAGWWPTGSSAARPTTPAGARFRCRPARPGAGSPPWRRRPASRRRPW